MRLPGRVVVGTVLFTETPAVLAESGGWENTEMNQMGFHLPGTHQMAGKAGMSSSGDTSLAGTEI